MVTFRRDYSSGIMSYAWYGKPKWIPGKRPEICSLCPMVPVSDGQHARTARAYSGSTIRDEATINFADFRPTQLRSVNFNNKPTRHVVSCRLK